MMSVVELFMGSTTPLRVGFNDVVVHEALLPLLLPQLEGFFELLHRSAVRSRGTLPDFDLTQTEILGSFYSVAAIRNQEVTVDHRHFHGAQWLPFAQGAVMTLVARLNCTALIGVQLIYGNFWEFTHTSLTFNQGFAFNGIVLFRQKVIKDVSDDRRPGARDY